MLNWWKEIGALMRWGTALCCLNIIVTFCAFQVTPLWYVAVVGTIILAAIVVIDAIRDHWQLRALMCRQDELLDQLRAGPILFDELPGDLQEDVRIAIAEQKLRDKPNPKKD